MAAFIMPTLNGVRLGNALIMKDRHLVESCGRDLPSYVRKVFGIA